MEVIKIIFILCILPFKVSAAFTEPEMSQLEKNEQEIKKTKYLNRTLDQTIKRIIKPSRTEKDIIKLKKS